MGHRHAAATPLPKSNESRRPHGCGAVHNYRHESISMALTTSLPGAVRAVVCTLVRGRWPVATYPSERPPTKLLQRVPGQGALSRKLAICKRSEGYFV